MRYIPVYGVAGTDELPWREVGVGVGRAANFK